MNDTRSRSITSLPAAARGSRCVRAWSTASLSTSPSSRATGHPANLLGRHFAAPESLARLRAGSRLSGRSITTRVPLSLRSTSTDAMSASINRSPRPLFSRGDGSFQRPCRLPRRGYGLRRARRRAGTTSPPAARACSIAFAPASQLARTTSRASMIRVPRHRRATARARCASSSATPCRPADVSVRGASGTASSRIASSATSSPRAPGPSSSSTTESDEVIRLARRPPGCLGEEVEPFVDRPVRTLYEAVRVEHYRRARLECRTPLGVRRVRIGPQRQPSRTLEVANVTLRLRRRAAAGGRPA